MYFPTYFLLSLTSVAALASFSGACFEVSNIPEDAASRPTDAVSIDAAPSVPDASPCRLNTHECTTVPVNWRGPAVLIRQTIGDEEAACPDGYQPIPGAVRMQGLVTPESSCTCECGTATQLTCEAGGAFASESPGFCFVSSCLEFDSDCVPNVTVQPNQCRTIQPGTTRLALQLPLVLSGTCADGATTGSFPDSSFQEQFTMCKGEELEFACPGGAECSLRTSGFEGRECIYSEGIHDCPANTPFTEPQLAYLGTNDERECSDCQCGAGLGGPCGIVQVTDDSDTCSSTTTHQNNRCAVVPANRPTALRYLNGPERHQCEITNTTEAVGSVVPLGALTACCKP